MLITREALRRRVAAVMVDYGVSGYGIRIEHTKGSWGHCDYTKRELVFNPSLLWTDWVFANQIILHEVAHAIAGRHTGHGRKWKDTAKAMGYRLGAIVPYSSPIVGEHRWVARCATGEHHAIRYERGADGLKCGPCNESGAGEVDVLWEEL